MPRFFVTKEQIQEEKDAKRIIITGDDAHHISYSLRMAKGDRVEVVDMQKNVYDCITENFSDGCVTLTVESERKSDTEPTIFIKLYQALPKGDKFETIIQKSVECGVCEITPFISERCIAKIDKKDEGRKTERWQKISESASKQSGRGIIPKIKVPISYKEMVAEASECDLFLFCYEGDNTESIKNVLQSLNWKITHTVSLVIGSEGGFSQKEAELARQNGAKLAGLGKRILRCETAAPFALACIAYETEF